MKLLTTKPITTVCLSPYKTKSMCHLLSQCSLSYKLTKKNFGQMKATACWIRTIFNCSIILMVSSVSHFTFQRWISSCSAVSCLTVSIERFVSFKSQSCPNSSLYLLNKCSLHRPQSILSFSCINNVIDLLFEKIYCQELIPDSLKKKKKARIGLELFCTLDSSLLVRFQIHFKFSLELSEMFVRL